MSQRVPSVGPWLADPSSMPSRTLLVLPFLAACVGNIQRSARVPHPSVPLASGQPLATQGEASVGLSNVTDITAPQVGDSSQAVEVPSTQLRSEARIRLNRRGQVALIYERGFASTSKQPDPNQAPVGRGDVAGYGMSFGYSFDTATPGLSIGTTLELMTWTVPWVEYTTCTNCLGQFTIEGHGRANAQTIGLGFAPSYRRGRVTLFGGVFIRNHPTTQRKETQVDITFGDDGEVRNGPFNALLHAGLEIELDKRVAALVLVHQDLTASPVQYGPGIGVALSARLGDTRVSGKP